ncbi:hypothetical protein BTR23_17160 [Alkalihalophilus pseudofirmus]|nr:hypothetical protein BTR23_17160 [Alkalihalophilus pseudofirmus]
MFKWMPHKEQNMCESKLIKVMKRLKIVDYHFNWDRNSCFIEFQYQENTYRLEHSAERAKLKGIVRLRNGLDCLNELVQSLEDLCKITERGTYNLETWLIAMKQSFPPAEELPEYLEEVHIRYKSLGKQNHDEYGRNESFIPVTAESLGSLGRSELIQRAQNK